MSYLAKDTDRYIEEVEEQCECGEETHWEVSASGQWLLCDDDGNVHDCRNAKILDVFFYC